MIFGERYENDKNTKESREHHCSLFCFEKISQRKGKQMEEEFKVIDNYLMIRMPNEIDHHHSSSISKTADEYIMDEKVGNVVFDFERTTFMDSSGIGIIVGRYKKISCFGGKVFAINADNRIRRILLLSGLHKIVEIM